MGWKVRQMNKKNINTIKIIVTAFLWCSLLWTNRKVANADIVSTNHQKYSYKEYVNDLKQLQEKYPHTCQVKKAGTTADNRKIYEVILGNPEAKKHLVVIANLHAREYMTTQLCMKQIEYYLKKYYKDMEEKTADTNEASDQLMDQVAIHYFPSCNPDGTAISQYGFKAIRNKTLRKNLYKMSGSSRTWKANARGVDLNRNWNMAFRRQGRRGSYGFTGYKAESEREVKALLKAVDSIEETGKIVGVISYHSTGSIIYGKCASDVNKKVKNTTTKMYRLAQKLTGYRVMPAEEADAEPGYSREYFLYKKKIPFITIEVGRGECPLGIGEFSSIWKKNKDLVIKQAMLFD